MLGSIIDAKKINIEQFKKKLFFVLKNVLFDKKYSGIVKYYYNLNNNFLLYYILSCNLFLWRQSWILNFPHHYSSI